MEKERNRKSKKKDSMIDNRDWYICHKYTDELRGKESDNKSKKKDSMTDNRDRYICHKCTDDKHQYYNHCCKCGGAGVMQGVTIEDSRSAKKNMH